MSAAWKSVAGVVKAAGPAGPRASRPQQAAGTAAVHLFGSRDSVALPAEKTRATLPGLLLITRALILLLVLGALAGCGKKNQPSPPPDEPNTYPRTYPRE